MARRNLFESLEPLAREPVSSSIMNMLINYLLSKRLKPGDKLPTETEFSQQLGVGRNSVREAIKMLSSFGIIEIKRGLGTYISKSMSPAVMNPLILSLVFEQGTSMELFEVRLLLETGATELVIQKADAQDIERLEEANRRLREAVERNREDSRKRLELDIDFHHTLMEITKNPLLVKMGKAIYTLFFTSIAKTVELDPTSGYRNHQLVIEAIKKRDEQLTRKVTRESLSFWRTIIDS